MKYTKEQAQDFLRNKKVYVNGKSKEIQEKLFECGCRWESYDKKDTYAHYPFLYIDVILDITSGDNMDLFINMDKIEITVEEILSIELVEPFNPFDRVLVRNGDDLDWVPRHFSDYFITANNEIKYNTIESVFWDQCIPYEGNEHLAFTTNSPEQC